MIVEATSDLNLFWQPSVIEFIFNSAKYNMSEFYFSSYNKLLKWMLFLVLPVVSLDAEAQEASEFYADKIYLPSIKTIQLYVDPLILTDPAIPLGGASQLHLEFDDLDGDKKNYYYTLIHCNFDWTPSDLSPFDYLSGFKEQDITDFSFSFNTKQSYAHYDLLFPNENIRPTKSGNYILKVYLDNDPEKVALTRRFIIFDSKAQLISDIHKPTNVKYTDTYQEADFVFNYRGISISNPINDVKILLMQNFRWDNAITSLQPLFMKTEELDYTYDLENAFPAGKEFRYFDTRSVRYRTERVSDIKADGTKTEVFLTPDISRGNQPYLFHKDINGKFIPGIIEGFNQKVEPDYVWVTFTLPFDYPLRSTNIYIIGQFTDWQMKEEFLMHYDADAGKYETRVYLKQGYYEYQYVTFDEKGEIADNELFEGNSYETENTYQIFAYYRSFGSRYDEVIAYKATDSFNNNR